MSNLPIQQGKFDDMFPQEAPTNQMMTLDLPAQYRMSKQTLIPPREKFMMDWITRFYPQVSLEHSEMTVEQMYNFLVNGGKMMNAKKMQAPKKEPVFQEIEYYVKLSEAHQSGKKLSKDSRWSFNKYQSVWEKRF